MNKSVNIIGRVLVGGLFLMAGLNKIGGYDGTQAYMESMGVAGMLLPAVIALEVLGGLALILGFQMRVFGFVLAGFTLLSGVIFHFSPGDQMQMILFMKNIAIAGGLLVIATQNAADTISIDARRG